MESVSRSNISHKELFEMTDSENFELTKGKLVKLVPAGYEHGNIVIKIGKLLSEFVEKESLGIVGGEAGFLLQQNPDTVRASDVYFVKKDRHEQTEVESYFPGPPDLAIEIISPTDKYEDIMTKVKEYFESGVTSVWLVNPKLKSVVRYNQVNESRTLEKNDVITEEDLLPGFHCQVKEFYV